VTTWFNFLLHRNALLSFSQQVFVSFPIITDIHIVLSATNT